MLSFLAIATTISCDDNDEELLIGQAEGQLQFKSTAATSYLLTFETKDNLAERLVWETVSFDTPISITYEVQASTDASNFDDALTITSTNGDSADLSVERLNEVAAELGLTPFTQANIAMRIKGTTADVSMEALLSDVLVLPVTPYTTDSPKLWVPGNYADSSGYGANWSPDDAETPFLEAVEFGSTEYEGFIFMSNASPEFKFTPTDVNFDGAFGDGGAGMLSNDGGAGNLTVPAAGYYYITVNTDPNGDGDFSDATWEATPRVWGIIGAATTPSNAAGWGDELDMTYDPASKVWSVELDMIADEFKFRAQQWNPNEYNFGINGDGELEFNAGNISVGTAGRYRVELDLSTPRAYTYSLTAI